MIYVNGRFLTQPMTGVERYAYNICKAMVRQDQPFTIVCPKAPVQSCYDTSGLHIVHYGIGNSHLWEQCVLPFFFIGKKDYLLFSFTGLGTILIRNKVMTIHDLSFLEDPSWFSKAYYWWYKVMTPLAVKTSRHIITVSEFSKKEIMRFYTFLRQQDISVLYGAPDTDRFRSLPDIEKPSERFVLAVSSMDPRKNFKRLIEAFHGIEDCKLFIVGANNRVFTSDSNPLPIGAAVRFLGRVSDDELVRLYHQATCFIFPSIYEGFGLPPIEAMCCSCPVLASDIPVLKEVCAEAAQYFNPYDTKDIRQAIIRFLSLDDKDKECMQALGHKNASRFSWEQSASKLLSIIRDLRVVNKKSI